MSNASIVIKKYIYFLYEGLTPQMYFTRNAIEYLKVCVAYLSFPMMHIAASSGSASWINFLNIFNRLFIFSISSGTNNARLAAMLRQLAQYHAKDPNNLFMVRLAQVGGSTKGILYQTRSELLGKCVCVYQLLLTLSCLCVHRV